MARDATVTLTRTAYDALMAWNEELEDRLAAIDADDGSRIRMRWRSQLCAASVRWPRSGAIAASRCAGLPNGLGSPQATCPKSNVGANRAPQRRCPASPPRWTPRSTPLLSDAAPG